MNGWVEKIGKFIQDVGAAISEETITKDIKKKYERSRCSYCREIESIKVDVCKSIGQYL